MILLHVLRAVTAQSMRSMHLKPADLSDTRPGKYSAAQLMHLGWTVAVLLAIATGLVPLKKAGVLLARDPTSCS